MWFLGFILLTQSFFPGTQAVNLQTETYETVLSGNLDEYLSFLGLQIELGFIDKRNLSISLQHKECDEELLKLIECDPSACRISISSENYSNANKPVQRLMELEVLQIMGKKCKN